MDKIYRNHIGNLDPTLGISCFRSVFDAADKGYLIIHGTSDSPDIGKKWSNTPEQIVEISIWAKSNGYDIDESRDGYNQYRARLTHRATQRALDEARAKDDTYFERAEIGYIRFGDIPACGYSKNRASGANERGVSVFKAQITKSGLYRVLLSTNQQHGSYLSLLADNRPVYRVYGDEVGIGGDGEPLLAITSAVRLD